MQPELMSLVCEAWGSVLRCVQVSGGECRCGSLVSAHLSFKRLWVRASPLYEIRKEADAGLGPVTNIPRSQA